MFLECAFHMHTKHSRSVSQIIFSIWLLHSDCGSVTKLCLTLANPWTVARQAPLSMGFLRQEYWSGLPFPSAGNLPNPRIEPASPALAGRFFTTEPPAIPLGAMGHSICWHTDFVVVIFYKTIIPFSTIS